MTAVPSLSKNFDYSLAFSRNLGWLTVEDQKKLATVRVGIVGMGGVGGQHAEILARLGVCHYVIADFDKFSIENTNRQNECKQSNYGRNKAEVIGELIRDINPEAQVEILREGIQSDSIDKFCHSVDIYVDSLDFFEINLRVMIFRKMYELKKTAITAGPIGSGTTMIVFDQHSMSFDDHFGIKDTDPDPVKYAKFLIGLKVDRHMTYLMEPQRFDLHKKKTASLPMGVYACATTLATALLKTVLHRGPVLKAPWVFHYDPYLLKSWRSYVWLGAKNPLQKLKIYLVLKKFGF